MEKKNKFLSTLKKSYIALLLVVFVTLIGCSNNELSDELKDCNNEICGYWKLFAIEYYSGTDNQDYTIEEGFEYLKITENEFEKIKYKEKNIYNYENYTYTYENKNIKTENKEYTVEFIEDKMVLSYNLNNNPTKAFYEKVEENEYPNLSIETGSEKVYSGTIENSCEDIQCGYWKLNEVIEKCGNDESVKIDGETILLSNYLKFDKSNIDWINYHNNKSLSITKDYYYLKKIDTKNYKLYYDSVAIQTDLIDQKNYSAGVYMGTLEENLLKLNVVYFAPEKETICVQTHNYQKITENEFPKINIYLE